mgnify:CR=1 FL=1
MKSISSILKGKSSISEFVYAGNSLFTLLNTKTGSRFTYRFKKGRRDNVWCVSVLTSPANFSYIGVSIFDENKKEYVYIHAKKSKVTLKAQSALTINWFISALNHDSIPENVEVWHNGRCGKCGRALTVPESIEVGLGPTCRGTV